MSNPTKRRPYYVERIPGSWQVIRFGFGAANMVVESHSTRKDAYASARQKNESADLAFQLRGA